jgi:trimeric autotransporter adhesin
VSPVPRTRFAGIATALAALLIGGSAAAAPILLRDVNPVAKERFLGGQSAIFANKLFTSLFSPETGTELAVVNLFDGSLDIIDVDPGPDSSFRFGTTFIPLNSRVLFTATTGEHGEELWASDGTPQGTVLVADIRPGNLGSRPQHLHKVDGDTVLFQADDGTNGRELWITDGEEALLFADIAPGEDSSDPHAIISTANGFLMTACDYGGVGCEPFFLRPFVTSGFLDIISPGQSAPREYATLANPAQAVFSGNISSTNSNDYELWITDVATVAGTSQLKNFISGGVGGDPRNFRLVNGVMVFDVDTSQNGRELFRTDGTSGGTVMVADIFPGPRSGIADDSNRALLGTSSLVFPAVFEDAGIELAVTDGFSVTRLADTIPGPRSGLLDRSVVATTTKVYTALADLEHGLELWETDGTPEGTALVADLLPGPSSSRPFLRAASGDTVYFLAHGPNGFGLFRRSDGAPSLVRDLSAGGTDDASVGRPARVGSRLLFPAFDPEAGSELWTTDGTPGGTARLVDLVPGFDSNSPFDLTTMGDRIFFSGTDGINGRELFVSDGTAAGTRMLVDIVPGDGSSFPDLQAVLGGRLLFSARTEAEGTELWISDGTPEGTQLLKDTKPGGAEGRPSGIVTSGDRAFFVAGPLWITDGTPAGTTPVDDELLVASPPVPFGQGSVLFGGTKTSSFDLELWISDGTAGGSRLVKELVAGANDGGNPRLITVAGSRAFFVATTNEGVGLWVTDGTDAGTTLVKAPLAPSEDEATFGLEVVAIGERVVFTVVANNGRSLWVSDGTPGGTQQVSGLCPTGQTCGPNQVFAYESVAFFNFDDGTHGMELWQTDGTPAGTGMVAELVPGTAPFTIFRTTVGVLDGKLFFSACEGTHGCEPWIFDFDQCPADTAKLAPGACGCAVADADTDGSGVADCLIGSELRARLDALRALIETVSKPKSKGERRAFKEKMAAISAAFDAVVAYRDARANDFPDLEKPLKKVKKAIKRLRRKRGATSARNKALSAVAAVRDVVVAP